MKSAFKTINVILQTLKQDNTLPVSQLRKLGIIYNGYRLVVSAFLLLMAYANIKADTDLLLLSLLQQTALGFYVILSLILLSLFLVATKQLQRQLVFGLGIDVIVLSLLLYTNGAPDLQLAMLYMVVVAASFMLLRSSQALVITLLAILFVIYQQFFHAISNSMSLTNLGDALLMSASFLAVGFLSWSISQRLVHVERFITRQAEEVERLNTINQEVISQMLNGIMVIDKQHIVLANHATYQLLGIPETEVSPFKEVPTNYRDPKPTLRQQQRNFKNHHNPLYAFQQALAHQHRALLNSCLSVPTNQSRNFVYELPEAATASITNKLRVQVIPLEDGSQLILLEDLRREQANAQQLKLASLGQLTASIAHEIRNPLAAISQASQLLLEDMNDVADADESHSQTAMNTSGNNELYKMIFAQTKRVNRIIEDVLKLSRQQRSNKQTIELGTWMPQFLENYFRGNDIFLHDISHPVIQFDNHQLEQILINLINNGLRYCGLVHPHAYAEVEIYCVQNDVIIDVLNEGEKIAPADVERLFDPFFTTDKAGTGLGLYLSQAFSEANHARLLYVAEHEKTCFRLITPMGSCSEVVWDDED